MLFMFWIATSGAPSIKSTTELSSWRNYEENYNEGIGCDNDVIDMVVCN